MQQLPETDITSVPAPLPAGLVVLDVREDDEWQAGHIHGALHIPLGSLPQRVSDIPAEQRILVVCRVGGRSAQATEFLRTQGRDAVNLAGGMQAWDAAGREMVAENGHAPAVA